MPPLPEFPEICSTYNEDPAGPQVFTIAPGEMRLQSGLWSAAHELTLRLVGFFLSEGNGGTVFKTFMVCGGVFQTKSLTPKLLLNIGSKLFKLKGQSNKILTSIFSSLEPTWETNQRVKIFLIYSS